MAPRSKVELHGLLERVIEMYTVDKMKLDDIAEALKEDGFDISRSSVHRVLRSNQELIEEQRLVQEQAEVFLKEFKDSPNTDISELNLQIMQRYMFKVLRELEFGPESFKDPNKLANLLARLSDAQVNLDRLKVEFRKGVDAAKVEFESQLTDMLKETRPELLLELVGIIQTIRIDQKPKRGRR
ncbi:phage protein Gp27 family protein [Vibrio sp. Vb339]|uniref:phage protein Gp27 family protein n=1 Tax=Vibrio sp. Vb339 TaxID=1192013 RepID=UPI001551656D|nr:phage protein Gp27 family protein [Vibrio sp. Vb339]